MGTVAERLRPRPIRPINRGEMGTTVGRDGERTAVRAQAQQQRVLAVLAARFREVPQADLEDAFSRTVTDLLVSPGRLADADDGQFIALLIDAAKKDVLNLLRAQGRRPEAHDADYTAEDDGDEGDDAVLDRVPDTAPRIDGVQEHRLLEYIAALPADDRTIAAMVLEHQRPRQIAPLVGLTAREVSRSWARSQGRLRTILARDIDETRLCGLVQPDMIAMREPGGRVSKNLRQHIRSCEACAMLVDEQVGQSAAGILGLPLPAVAGAGGGAWWMFGRHARRAGTQAHSLLGGAGRRRRWSRRRLPSRPLSRSLRPVVRLSARSRSSTTTTIIIGSVRVWWRRPPAP